MSAATQILTSNNGPVLFGVGGTAAYTTAGSPTWVWAIVSATLTFQMDNVDASAAGVLFASAATNPHDMLSLECLYYDPGTGITQANLLSGFVAPTPKQIVTISGAGARINGDWNFEGLSQPRQNGQYVSTTFTLSRKGNDGTTALPKAFVVTG
jgi:hypothetical protein